MNFDELLASTAKAEWQRFGSLREDQEPLKSRIGEYYRHLGSPFDGGDRDIAWSAAFVSYMMKLAGAGTHFPSSILHAEYIWRCIGNQQIGVGIFRGLDPADGPIRPGDVICTNRPDKPPMSYAQASSQSSYFSHCDIVVSVASGGGNLEAIGGNVGDRIGKSDYHRDGDLWRQVGAPNHRIFCMIRATAWVEDVA